MGGNTVEAEAAVVGVLAIGGVEVVDGGEDELVFVASLIGAATVNPGVVDLGVEDVGLLILRVAALVAELGEVIDLPRIEDADALWVGG